MAKNLTNNAVMGLVGTASTNYIQKISDGTTEHVLTVENGITFFNGKQDTTGVTWDGIQPLEVIIPTLSDIVSNPVVLKGVVNSASDIPGTASNGDLLYIGTAGPYFNPAVPCEAGDMAIYYNSAWHVISGEEQITINAAAATASGNDYEFSISGTPKTILNVEGKTVTLVLDYADIRSKVTVDKEGTEGLSVTGGKVNVAAKYVGLSQATGTTLDISKTVSIDLPTALESGAVKINESVLASGDFNFTAGSFPTIAKNAEAISVTASHNMTIAKSGADGATGDYVTDVVAIKGVAFAAGTSTSNDLSYVGGLSAASGKSFVSGLHAWTQDDGEKAADFTVYGAVTADSNANTFATGFGDEGASGDVVSSITVGTVSIASGAGILTGLSGKGNTVLTSVTFGTAVSDAGNAWFYNGLGDGNDVVTAVDFGSTTLVADAQSSFKANAMVSASVSNHVLTFTSAAFMTPVGVSTTGQGTTKAGFTKSGVSLSGFDSTSDSFTTGSLSQATTSISYKSLATAAVSLTQDSIKYYLDKGEGNAYDVVMSYVKFNFTDATMSKNTPVLSNTAITANIPAGQVAVGLSGGTLPSLEISAPSAGLTGSVSTSLTTESVSWLGIDSTKAATIPGAYTLVEDSATFEGAIEVAEATEYGVTSATVAIPAGAFVTDVYVDGVAVTVNPSNQGE